MNLAFSNSLFKPIKLRCLLLGCALINACGTEPTPVHDYLTRLSNVLEVPIDSHANSSKETSTTHFPSFPKPRNLQFSAIKGELSIREFLSLRECKLHTTIAHRNSLIGKVSSASQRLFSDLRILQQGPECITQLGESVLAKKLQQFLDLKQSQIQQTLWSALLAQNEHRKFWQANDYDPRYPTIIEIETSNSLNALAVFSRNILIGKYDFSDAEFTSVEQHLGQLRFGDGGRLLSRYLEQLNKLNIANNIIRTRLKRPLCFEQKTNTQARYFDNVIRTYFILNVQRNAVQLNQRAETLITAHQQLEEPLLQYANKDYQEWVNRRNSLLSQAKTATTEHVKLIQKLYAQCNLTPGHSE